MNIFKIDSLTFARPSTVPFFKEGSNDEAILLLHGYNGYVPDLVYCAEKLHEKGYTVLIPRLPGHGTNASDFQQTGWKDWMRCACDSFFDLKARYKTVHVTGFSMGGMLALNLAAAFETGSLALISPAIINTKKSIYLTPILKWFVRKTPRVWVDDTVDEDRLYLATQYWSWNWLKTGAELFALQRRTRRVLKKVEKDCLIIVSKKDEQVPTVVAEYIKNRVKGRVETVVLEHSPHVSVLGPEKDLIANRLQQWYSTGK